MRRPRVLVVDDDASVCNFISTTLQKAGYEVDIALTGKEAIAKVIKFRPQCLILEVFLPDTNGYVVCRQVRRKIPEQKMRIILTSMKDAPLDQCYGLRQGANCYLPKPLTAEALIQTAWQMIPEAFHKVVLPTFFLVQQQQARRTVLKLIPRRLPNQEAMRASNPFADSPIIKDEQARQFYAAIDGRKTVLELTAATNLGIKEAIRTLHELLRENYIQIYDSMGQLVEKDLLLSTL